MDAPRLSRAELGRLDRAATLELGLPVAVLMENAGRGAAEHVLALLANPTARSGKPGRVAVFAGGGNNGGDACVLARHLALASTEVEIFAARATEDLHGDAAVMQRAAERLGIPVHDVASEGGLERARPRFEAATVVVDGILGTGFEGEVRPAAARLIEAIEGCRRRGAIVVALDLPSGLDADSGRPARPTVRADLTVTFAAWKAGFDSAEARPHLGRIVLVPIGVPLDWPARARR